jgi:hypothetical protein
MSWDHIIKTRKGKCVKNKHHHHNTKPHDLVAIDSTNLIKIEIKA